jgi:hypothetical protein
VADLLENTRAAAIDLNAYQTETPTTTLERELVL